MTTYYAKKLSGSRLRAAYDLAPPRVRQYLAAEVEFVSSRIQPGDLVLELGCGYGRVDVELAKIAGRVIGIDNARDNLILARRLAADHSGCEFLMMDAVRLGFRASTFDTVVCIQNGICAFRVDPLPLLEEALRVARPGGRVLFSSYAERFWPHRLDWFERQAAAGLVGEIDTEATGHGFIVCRDGFRSGTMSPAGFESLCARLGLFGRIEEIDGSSLFCEIDLSLEADHPPRHG